MSDYLIVGKKGTGKSKYALQKIHDYLSEGRKVATNIDIDLAALCKPTSRLTIIRVPDKPSLADLQLIGQGNDSYDEDLNGGLFLDECATWLNARTFNDKNRVGVIDFGVHGRKLGWDMWFMCQDAGQIDKQIRESLIEYIVRCMKLDKMKIPVIGTFLLGITGGKYGRFPKLHLASTRLRESPDIVIDREWYKGKFYEKCYDTRQKFRDWIRDPKDPGYLNEIYVGPYSVLSAWHLRGRYEQAAPSLSLFQQILQQIFTDRPRPAPVLKPKHPIVAIIMRLPVDQRLRHFKRLQERGVF